VVCDETIMCTRMCLESVASLIIQLAPCILRERHIFNASLILVNDRLQWRCIIDFVVQHDEESGT
jgi:hypothetical protein